VVEVEVLDRRLKEVVEEEVVEKTRVERERREGGKAREAGSDDRAFQSIESSEHSRQLRLMTSVLQAGSRPRSAKDERKRREREGNQTHRSLRAKSVRTISRRVSKQGPSWTEHSRDRLVRGASI